MRLSLIATSAALAASAAAAPQLVVPHSHNETVAQQSIISELVRIQSKIDAAALKSKTADMAYATITASAQDPTPKNLLSILMQDQLDMPRHLLFAKWLQGHQQASATTKTDDQDDLDHTQDPDIDSMLAAILGHRLHTSTTSKDFAHAYPTKAESSNTHKITAGPNTWTDDHPNHGTDYFRTPNQTSYSVSSHSGSKKTSSTKNILHASRPTTYIKNSSYPPSTKTSSSKKSPRAAKPTSSRKNRSYPASQSSSSFKPYHSPAPKLTTSDQNNSFATSKTSRYHHTSKATTLTKSRIYGASFKTSHPTKSTTRHVESKVPYSYDSQTHSTPAPVTESYSFVVPPPHMGPGNIGHLYKSTASGKASYTSHVDTIVEITTTHPSSTSRLNDADDNAEGSITSASHVSTGIATFPCVQSPTGYHSAAGETETQTAQQTSPREPQPSPPAKSAEDELKLRLVPAAMHTHEASATARSPRFPVSIDGHYTIMDDEPPTSAWSIPAGMTLVPLTQPTFAPAVVVTRTTTAADVNQPVTTRTITGAAEPTSS